MFEWPKSLVWWAWVCWGRTAWIGSFPEREDEESWAKHAKPLWGHMEWALSNVANQAVPLVAPLVGPPGSG